jgi:hypothetical protein
MHRARRRTFAANGLFAAPVLPLAGAGLAWPYN